MTALLLTSILFATLNGVVIHIIGFKTKKETFALNFISSVLWLIIFLALNGMNINFSYGSILFGVIYGITQVFFLIFKSRAMTEGPVSITTLVGNCSLLLSTAVSIILWKENVSIPQILGIILLIVSVIFCMYTKTEMNATKMWKFYCIAFFACTSAVGIIFKAFSKLAPDTNANDMMIIAAMVMAVSLFVLTIMQKGSVKASVTRKLPFIIACGILSCVYNRLNIFLSANLSGVIFFPAFNGGTVFASALAGIFMLKERLSLKQKTAIATGIIAIIVIGVFQ